MATHKFLSRSTLVYLIVIPVLYFVFSFTMLNKDPKKIQVNDPVLKEFLALWGADHNNLIKKGELKKKQWSSIRKINFEFSSKLSKTWGDKFTPPIELNHKGHYELDVLIMTWTEEGKVGVIAQFDLMNFKTKNLIHEFSRTYYLKKYKNTSINRQNQKSQQK